MNCSICLKKKIDITTLCNHQFHNKCLSEWLNINNSCPICRTKNPIQKNIKYKFIIRHSYGFYINLEKYEWNKELCNKNYNSTHVVEFWKPYGVLGKCSCGCIQAFNYKY